MEDRYSKKQNKTKHERQIQQKQTKQNKTKTTTTTTTIITTVQKYTNSPQMMMKCFFYKR